jgi:hypothetical protein
MQRFVQLKVTSSGSEVRIRTRAARPARNTERWRRWWGWRKTLAACPRAATWAPATAGRVGSRVCIPATAAGARQGRSTLSSGIERSSTSARPVDRCDHEVPLVVPRLTFINADRRLLALAVDAHDAATHGARGGVDEAVIGDSGCARESARRRRRAATGRRLGTRGSSAGLAGLAALATAGSGGGARSGTLTWHRGLCSNPDHVEILLSDRIEVFLSKELPLDQDIDARRECVGVLRAVQRNRTGVLFPAEHQLRFLLALGRVSPRWERDAHEDGHHGEADEQRRHRVTPVLTL